MMWAVGAFFLGAALGVLVMALCAAASDNEWKIAYLNTRDRLWKLEREQEHA